MNAKSPGARARTRERVLLRVYGEIGEPVPLRVYGVIGEPVPPWLERLIP